jgi:putrescine aminotransferase
MSVTAVGNRRSRRAQMSELSYYNTFFKTTHPPVIELSQMIAKLAPEHYNHDVLCLGSGSEANDTVLRLVRYYWDLKGSLRKKTIITRKNAYHGSTIAGHELGGMKAMHAQGDLPIPGIHHIDQPYWFDEGMVTCRRGLRPCRGAQARSAD